MRKFRRYLYLRRVGVSAYLSDHHLYDGTWLYFGCDYTNPSWPGIFTDFFRKAELVDLARAGSLSVQREPVVIALFIDVSLTLNTAIASNP